MIHLGQDPAKHNQQTSLPEETKMSNHGLRELNAVCLCTSYRLPSPLGNPYFEGKKVYKTKQKIHFRNQHQPFAF
jgi:hypothetical protein